jgi:hypothetical protein
MEIVKYCIDVSTNYNLTTEQIDEKTSVFY